VRIHVSWYFCTSGEKFVLAAKFGLVSVEKRGVAAGS
jgi:hypothetical protein